MLWPEISPEVNLWASSSARLGGTFLPSCPLAKDLGYAASQRVNLQMAWVVWRRSFSSRSALVDPAFFPAQQLYDRYEVLASVGLDSDAEH